MQLSEHSTTASDRLVSAMHESRCVLFATGASEPPVQSIRRAEALARLLGVPLNVLRVLPQLDRAPLLQTVHLDDSARMLDEFIFAARESSRWCRTVLPCFADEQLAVHVGSFAEQVATCAEQLRAALIVVAAGELSGTRVTELVRVTGLPVLVGPHSSSGSSTIVAAINLKRRDTPVLHLARALGHLRHAPVVAVHNVPSVRQLISRLNPARLVQQQRALVACQRELAQVSAQLGVASAVVVQAADPVVAIMAEARALEADVVVVGTRAGRRLNRFLRKSVAARLVDEAQGSVLVEPIHQA
jgi:nucleotide-binding universal stress UspA family protein